MTPYRHAAFLPLLLAGASSAMAQAPSFDERGRLTASPTAQGWGFEEADPISWPTYGFDSLGNPAVPSPEIIAEPLQGERALRVAPDGLRSVIIDLRSAGIGSDQQVDFRVWQRADGTRLSASVIWAVGDVDAAITTGDFQGLLVLSQVVLRPTQHRTDDGWQQWSSGPIDFALGQRILPFVLFQDHGQRLSPPVQTAGQVWVDAFEIDVTGGARVPDQACDLPNESAVCGAEGRCWLGRCVDARAVDGPDFASAEHRQQYFDRRRFELTVWAGHRKAQANMMQAQQILADLQANEPKDMWTRIGVAYEVLEDGHAARPRVAGRGGLGAGVCAHLGEADLHPQPSLLPIVFRTSSDHPLGAALVRGDVIESIDGLSPSDWRDLIRGGFDFTGDADARDFVETSRLLNEVIWRASTLFVRRCEDPDAPQCGMVRLALDLSAIVAPIWSGTRPDWFASNPPCDARFNRAAGDSGVANYIHAAAGDYQGLPVLQANSTPGPGFPGWAAWRQTIETTLNAGPSQLIFDERRGDGGNFAGVHLISSYFFTADDAPVDITVPVLGSRENDAAVRTALATCAQNSPSAGYFDCGGNFWASPALTLGPAPANNSLDATKLAVLTGIDGSGNDWLTHHLRIARSSTVGETRVFGPIQLIGAYGEVVSLPLYDVGMSAPRLQWIGGVILWNDQQRLDAHVGAEGVVPDEIIFQRQRDAIRGVDTALTEARRWLTAP